MLTGPEKGELRRRTTAPTQASIHRKLRRCVPSPNFHGTGGLSKKTKGESLLTTIPPCTAWTVYIMSFHTSARGRNAENLRVELERLISFLDVSKRSTVLERLLRSDLVDLQSERTIFAILLPITSRGSKSPSDCLHGLTSFADSLLGTAWRDRHEHGVLFDFKIYLELDVDDKFLQGLNTAETCRYR